MITDMEVGGQTDRQTGVGQTETAVLVLLDRYRFVATEQADAYIYRQVLCPSMLMLVNY